MQPSKEYIDQLFQLLKYGFTSIRSSGPGGQHVNKVATGVVLRCDIGVCDLPEEVKARFLDIADHRISEAGVVTIKVTKFRSAYRNKKHALANLRALLLIAATKPKIRKASKPSARAVKKRLDGKARKSALKESRRAPEME